MKSHNLSLLFQRSPSLLKNGSTPCFQMNPMGPGIMKNSPKSFAKENSIPGTFRNSKILRGSIKILKTSYNVPAILPIFFHKASKNEGIFKNSAIPDNMFHSFPAAATILDHTPAIPVPILSQNSFVNNCFNPCAIVLPTAPIPPLPPPSPVIVLNNHPPSASPAIPPSIAPINPPIGTATGAKRPPENPERARPAAPPNHPPNNSPRPAPTAIAAEAAIDSPDAQFSANVIRGPTTGILFRIFLSALTPPIPIILSRKR